MHKFISKTIGIQHSPFIRIGGHNTFPPLLLAIAQTDGSYKNREGRVAAILTSRDQQQQYKSTRKLFDAENSTEAEWAAVTYGLELALKHGEDAVGIENDNLGVVGTLITNKNPKQEYAKYYKHKITTMTQQTAWTGVRWIPREINKADALLR